MSNLPILSVLADGPKFCPNIKPSELDLVSSVQAIRSKIGGQDRRLLFEAQALKILSGLVGDSYRFDMRNFRKMRQVTAAEHIEPDPGIAKY